MKDFIKKTVCDGISVVSVEADKFKTNELSVTFALPLDKKTAAANAMLINLISNCSAAYPTTTELNKKLAYLYGASIGSVSSKCGENQSLSIVVSSLDDRFSIDNESISRQVVELVLSLIFEPRLDENGNFFKEDIERERRLLIEKIESEQNEKRLYALHRLVEEMFKDEKYSINPYGTIEDARAVTNEDLLSSLEAFRKNALVFITTVGSSKTDEIEELIKSRFNGVQREFIKPVKSEFIPCAKQVNTVSERQKIKQGKLVLGFRVNMKEDDEKTFAMRAFCDVFGGGPYSKLFMNVREKLSLCYYCSARYDRRKSNIIIQCGCEEENMDKAVNEILSQFEDIKKGNFKEEYEASKIGLSESLKSANDEPSIINMWYSSQCCDGDIYSPNEAALKNDGVTFDEIRDCSELLSLDTVFKLMSEKEE